MPYTNHCIKRILLVGCLIKACTETILSIETDKSDKSEYTDKNASLDRKEQSGHGLHPFALRKAKIVYNFGRSEGNRFKLFATVSASL